MSDGPETSAFTDTWLGSFCLMDQRFGPLRHENVSSSAASIVASVLCGAVARDPFDGILPRRNLDSLPNDPVASILRKKRLC